MLNTTTSSKVFVNPYDFYLWALTVADPRTEGWLLVGSPLPVFMFIFTYLFIVWIGPQLMKDRKPFNVDWLMLPYNLSMAILNAYICWQLFSASMTLNYSYICEPNQKQNNPADYKMVNAVWWYYFSKLIEFSDTFFFILRKKERQLTFLHVYHHSTMFPIWWIGVKWVPSGSTFFPAMVNSFIHIIMYSYYGLTVLGPRVHKILRWKKYLTVLQLVQFTGALIMGINGIVTGCDFPLWMHYTLIVYMTTFIILFGKFFANEYSKKKINVNIKNEVVAKSNEIKFKVL